MKKFALSLIALMTLGNVALAQDDVYFVPTKKALRNEQQQIFRSHTQEAPPQYGETLEYDTWADGRSNTMRNIDDYNRRNKKGLKKHHRDSISFKEHDVEEQNMTGRIVRFRSPRAVIVASPFYYDYYYDLAYYDPWFSDWGWRGWYGWYDPFYAGFGWSIRFSPWSWHTWYSPWLNSWYSPWHGGWSWHAWHYPYPYVWDRYYGWNHYNRFGRRNGVYYGEVRGSNASYGSRGGSFSSRGGSNVTRGGSFAGRGGSFGTRSGNDFSRSGNNATYGSSRSSYSGGGTTSRRGNIISHGRNGQNNISNSTPTSPPPTRAQSSSGNSNTFGNSRGGGFSSGYSGGSFSSGGSSRSGGFSSSGGSSRGSGRIVGGRR